MLYSIQVQHPDQMKWVLQKYPIEKYTWIVSDLKSKLDLQNKSLAEHGFYTDEQALRISDFWKEWHRRLLPDYQIVSDQAMVSYIEIEFQKKKELFHFDEYQIGTLFSYLNTLYPLFISNQHHQLMEWFQEHQFNKSEHHWYKWYLSAKLIFESLSDKKIILARWICYHLSQKPIEMFRVERPLVLDLGSEMTSVEMDFFNRLAKSIDIFLVEPETLFNQQFKYLLKTYEVNQGLSRKIKIDEPVIEQKISSDSYKRFTTELSEVQWITLKVREWIESGISPHKIGLLSSRQEDYWPLLQFYFETEGIPVQKNKVTTYSSLNFYQILQGRLQLKSQNLNWENVELVYKHDRENEHQISFDRVRSLYFELTELQELSRDSNIEKIYLGQLNIHKEISRDEFLTLILLESLKIEDVQILYADFSVLFKDFLSTTMEMSVSFNTWFKIWQDFISRKEKTIIDSNSEGVQLRAFGAVYMSDLTHQIWYGLDESALISKQQILIPVKDIEELKKTFDFPLPYPEESHDEFNLMWGSQTGCVEKYMTCSHFNIKGEPLTTSHFILKSNPSPDVDYENLTLVRQNQYFLKTENEKKLLRENDLQFFDPVEFQLKEVSVNQVSDYANCGFKLLADKGFKLRESSVISIELDPLQRGSLIHALFEFLMTEEVYKNVSETQISDFLEDYRNKKQLFPNDDVFWAVQKQKYQNTAEKFIEFEKNRHQGLSFKSFLEKSFELDIHDFKIRGRIDRYDVFTKTNHFIVYDYKRTNSDSYSHFNQWLKENEFQLMIYALALLQQGFSVDQFKGSLYYFYQKLETKKGLFIEKTEEGLDLVKDQVCKPSRNAVSTPEEFFTLKQDFEVRIKDLIDDLRLFKFSPVPNDPEICSTCDWNKLCRAPHLN